MKPSTKSRLNSWNELALLAPAICAGVYVFSIVEGSFWNRLLSALGLAVAIPIAAMIGYALSLALAVKLLRIEGEREAIRGLATHHVLAGLLMVTFVWIWWQQDKRNAIGEVAQCATEVARNRSSAIDSLSILACYTRGRPASESE